MKKLICLLLCLSLPVSACLGLSSCSWFEPEHAHQCGAWTLLTVPTETESGLAERFCELEGCTHSDKVIVTPLTDTVTWTLVSSTDPTHLEEGVRVYTSVYGTVNLPIPAIPHEFGGWSMTVTATLTETGVATRHCDCGYVEESVVPVLTDESVWTMTITEADAENPEKHTYTSVWGTVEYTVGNAKE